MFFIHKIIVKAMPSSLIKTTEDWDGMLESIDWHVNGNKPIGFLDSVYVYNI